MGKRKKTVLKRFNYWECDLFAEYLSMMAARGWHFKEWKIGLVFEKGEPKTVTYAVEVFAKAKDSDMCPGTDTQEFAEYCEAAGWELVDAKYKFCIFKKIADDAMNMFTPKERVENCYKAEASGLVWCQLLAWGILAGLQWTEVLLQRSAVEVFFSNSVLFKFVIFHVLFLFYVGKIVRASWLRYRYNRKIQAGEEVFFGTRYFVKIDAMGWYALGVLFFLIMEGQYYDLVGFFCLVIFNGGYLLWLHYKRPERESIMANVFLITAGVIILFAILPELRENDRQQDYFCGKTVFGTSVRDYRDGILETYESPYDAILDRVWDSALRRTDGNKKLEDCTERWKARKAVRTQRGVYYIRYDGKVIRYCDEEYKLLSQKEIAHLLKKWNVR